MTSVIGNSPRSRLRRSGFSLIEIVLVLGLMAVAASIVIANFASMADRGGSRTTEELLREAVKEARFIAAHNREVSSLRFDKESGKLVIETPSGIGPSYDLPEEFGKNGRNSIDFFLIPPARGLGRLTTAEDIQATTPRVRFAPDRSSSPFVAEINGETPTPQRLIFDPFSSLLITPES